jgi:hypothetical protein
VTLLIKDAKLIKELDGEIQKEKKKNYPHS